MPRWKERDHVRPDIKLTPSAVCVSIRNWRFVFSGDAKADGQEKIAYPEFTQGDLNDVFVKQPGRVADFDGIICGDRALATAAPTLVITQCAVSCAGGALGASRDADAHGAPSPSCVRRQGNIDRQTFETLGFGASH